MAIQPTLDRFTVYSALGGALAGAKQYPPLTALGVAIALEAWETFRERYEGRDPPPNDLERHVFNITAGMLGYGVALAVTHVRTRGAR